MRVRSLELEGFRGFSRPAEFDLQADAVIVAGANGQGKTSFFDAIMWGICGAVPRLGSDAEGVVSLYAASAQARVRIVLSASNGDEIDVIRSVSEGDVKIAVRVGSKKRQGEAAEAFLLEHVWPDALVTPDGGGALVSALTTSVYLQQDRIRDFVEAKDEKDRFAAVGELVGTGRILELQIELEKQKKAWARSSSSLVKERDLNDERISRLQADLERLSTESSEPSAALEPFWIDWWNELHQVTSAYPAPPGMGNNDAPAALDRAVRELQANGYRMEQRRDRAARLLERLQNQAWQQDSGDVSQLDRELERTREELSMAHAKLAAAQAEAAEFRRRLVQAREATEELRSMTELALRHLGDVCPICSQAYDRVATELQLRQRLTMEHLDPKSTSEMLPDVGALASEVESLEKRVSLEERVLDAKHDQKTLLDELEALGLGLENTLEDPRDVARLFIDGLRGQLEVVAALQRRAEALSLRLTRASEEARRTELSSELSRLIQVRGETATEIESRERSADLAGRLIDALRVAASEVVQLRLRDVEPLLQSVYSAINPHPALRTVRFLSRLSYGRGRLSTSVGDSHRQLECEHPEWVLSSSQLSALAVSVFLALNLGLSKSPLDAVILDDPLQNLDDINLLGLIDLLRRTKSRRQLFISTHDDRFAGLLERKLRPVSQEERTRVLRFTGWERSGPIVDAYDIEPQTTSLRLVSS